MTDKQTTDTGAGYYMKRTGPLLLDEFWSPTILAEANAAIKAAHAIMPPCKTGKGEQIEEHK